jgi:predicted metal-dependent phosphoesterase TrpH
VYTIREAFDRYLSYDTGVISLVGDYFIAAPEAVRTILQAGGLPVLAHPTIELFDRYLPSLLECGLRGIEVFKSSRPVIEEYYFETVAKDKNLLITGGSDWHGHRLNQKLGAFSVDSTRVGSFLQALQSA